MTTQPTRRPQAERSATTKAALIAAGRRLFTVEGHQVPTGRLAVEAGVSRGALVHHFGAKEGLFAAVFEQLEAELTAELTDVFLGNAELPTRELFELCIRAFLDLCEQPEVLSIGLTSAPIVLGWTAWREVEERHGLGLLIQMLTSLPSVTEAGLDPVVLARLALGAIIEAALLIAHATDPVETRSRAERSLMALLSGAFPHPDNSTRPIPRKSSRAVAAHSRTRNR